MDDGRVGHAELALGGGVLYLADEYPEIGLKAPAPQSVSVSLMLPVADTDAALERARDRGADVQREPYENYGSRSATIIDPFGHRWMLSGPMTGASAPIQHGDVGYVSVWTPDADRAAAFYGHVLGWTYDPATHQVTNTEQHIGIVRGRPARRRCSAATRSPTWQRRAQAILDAGGQAGEVRGVRLRHRASTPPIRGHRVRGVPAEPGAAAARSSTALGQANFRTSPTRSRDSAAFRAFYSRVLFWTFEPGRVDDGWQIQGSASDGRRRRRQRRAT